jgi:hypothetical protein
VGAASAGQSNFTFELRVISTTPIVLTANANGGKLTKGRNPDHDAHKDALPVDIQDPSLAAGDLDAPGIGGCAWAEPVLDGSALAFLTLGTLLDKKGQLVPDRERRRLACWSPDRVREISTGYYRHYLLLGVDHSPRQKAPDGSTEFAKVCGPAGAIVVFIISPQRGENVGRMWRG